MKPKNPKEVKSQTEKIEKKTEVKNLLVVTELPTQQVREVIGDDKKNYEMLTVNEALTEMLTILRKIDEET